MNEVARKNAIYIQIGHRARQAAVAHLRPVIGAFNVTEWTKRAFDGLWSPTEFPWDRINTTIRDPDRLEIAIWVERRLIGMAIARTNGDDVIIEFIEGDPAPDAPLKGFRTLVALDVAANYAQARGKHRLLVQPMNSGLVEHYKKFGFSPFPPNQGSPYMWKKV